MPEARALSPRAVGAALCSCFLVACGGGTSVTSDYDPSADFSSYQTYSWAERTPAGDDDPRVYNSVTMRRVRTAVERALGDKGFEKVDSSGDFMVAWHGALEGRMSYRTINGHYGYGWGWYGGMGASSTYVNEWDEGTLLVDLIDGRSNELVWRGSATGTVDQGESTPVEAQRMLDEAASRLLETFPPESG